MITDKHKHFAMLYQVLLNIFQVQQGYVILSSSMEVIFMDAAYKLKSHIEGEGDPSPPVVLETAQYKEILQEVFLDSKPQQEAAGGGAISTTTSAAPAAPALIEDSLKQIIHLLQRLLPTPEQLEGNSHKEQKSAATGITMYDDATAAEIKEANQKVSDILLMLEYQLLIKGITDRINSIYLENKKTLIVLQDDGNYISKWEETRKALSLIGFIPGSVVIVTTKNSQGAKKFCCPPGEPITYSLVGLYHDIALELTKDKRKDSYDPQILLTVISAMDSRKSK